MVKGKKTHRQRSPQRKKSTKQTTRERKKIRIAKKKASKRKARGPGGFSSTEGDELGRDHPSEWYQADLNEMSKELDQQPRHLNKDYHEYWGPPASSRRPSISPLRSFRKKKNTKNIINSGSISSKWIWCI